MPHKKALIAIVDDDESVRDAMKSLMRSLGFAAESFSSGEDFLASAHVARTACLLADVNMPGMSGLELHRRLASAGNNIPTILITAYPNEGTRSRALNNGVLCYLTKPCGEEELVSCIRIATAQGKRGECESSA